MIKPVVVGRVEDEVDYRVTLLVRYIDSGLIIIEMIRQARPTRTR